MTIPDYQTMMRPILEICKNSKKNTNDVIREIAEKYKLSKEDLEILQPNGKNLLIRNRIGWAFTYLFAAELLDRPEAGHYITTDIGKKTLKENPDRIDNSILQKFEPFRKWRDKSKSKKTNIDKENDQMDTRTPDEKIRDAHQDINDKLKAELLQKILKCSPDFFEKMVLDLLIAMNYGGSYEEARQHVGQTNDGGIDGIINKDRLGMDKIFIQAKRWNKNNISRKELQAFVGSLAIKKANKGLFITTSEFTSESKKYAQKVPENIVIIDNDKLTDLMIEYNVGVKLVDVYKTSMIDRDFFPEN